MNVTVTRPRTRRAAFRATAAEIAAGGRAARGRRRLCGPAAGVAAKSAAGKTFRMKPCRPAAGGPLPIAVPLLAASLLAAGCGGPTSPPADAPAGGEVAEAAPPPAAEPALTPFTDPAGRKWLTETIPYDAFATAPGTVPEPAAARRPPAADLLADIGTGSAVPGRLPGDRGGARGAVSVPGSVGGDGRGKEPAAGWAAVISAEDLRDEIARARNVLAAAVGTVAAFNRGLPDVRREAAVLAAAAEIAGEHPGYVPWKEHAAAVRSLAVRVGDAAESGGRPARTAARLSFDTLDSVLGGNPPPDGAVDDFDRPVQADRGALMRRMEAALESLQQDAPDAAALARGGDGLAREAAVLAALAEFGAHPDYDGAANDDYRGWTDDLVAAAKDAARFAREEPDLAEFDAAVSRASAACAACHAEYRL